MRRCLHCEVCSCTFKPPSPAVGPTAELFALHGKGEQRTAAPLLSCTYWALTLTSKGLSLAHSRRLHSAASALAMSPAPIHCEEVLGAVLPKILTLQEGQGTGLAER